MHCSQKKPTMTITHCLNYKGSIHIYVHGAGLMVRMGGFLCNWTKWAWAPVNNPAILADDSILPALVARLATAFLLHLTIRIVGQRGGIQ